LLRPCFAGRRRTRATSRAGFGILIAALICLVGGLAPGYAAEFQSLEIVSKEGVHVFAVELAANDEQRARGLMHRRELPEGQGMLFDFQRDQEVAMWMQNTFISLDMIFIRRDGTIARIAENTEPLSTRIVPSQGPVRAVLEVIGGTARKLGIAAGDRVAHPLFANR
jgi:uncharacterized membrane protein (UPF0127 family)